MVYSIILLPLVGWTLGQNSLYSGNTLDCVSSPPDGTAAATICVLGMPQSGVYGTIKVFCLDYKVDYSRRDTSGRNLLLSRKSETEGSVELVMLMWLRNSCPRFVVDCSHDAFVIMICALLKHQVGLGGGYTFFYLSLAADRYKVHHASSFSSDRPALDMLEIAVRSTPRQSPPGLGLSTCCRLHQFATCSDWTQSQENCIPVKS